MWEIAAHTGSAGTTMTDPPKPYPKNAAGDFYVEDGCCVTCGAPMLEAPELFAWDEEEAGYPHCFVRRQPENRPEVTQMLKAIWYAETGCIRYRGADAEILSRLGAMGEPGVIDFPPLGGVPVVFRNRVKFELKEPVPGLHSLLRRFRDNLTQVADPGHFRCLGPWPGWPPGSAALRVSWAGGLGHRIDAAWLTPGAVVLVRHSRRERAGSRAVSLLLHEWLETARGIADVRWFSEEEWDAGSNGASEPW